MASSIQEIAEILGVSITTVSRSLNDRPGINQETRARVKSLAQKLNYRPNHIAQSLASGKTNTLGVLTGDLQEPHYAELAQRIEESAEQRGFNVILAPIIAGRDFDSKLTNLRSRGVDGIIVTAAYSEEQLSGLWQLLVDKVPVVVGANTEHFSTDYVRVNGVEATRVAVKHLIDLGHKKIAYLSLSKTITAHHRFNGFQSAMQEAGIPIKDELLIKCLGYRFEAYQHMKEILQLQDRPTAIYAHNDLAAIGAMRAIREAGLSVPYDISIISYGNTEDCEYQAVKLTAIDYPRAELAGHLTDLMQKRISMPESPVQQVVLESNLVMRESVAPPRE